MKEIVARGQVVGLHAKMVCRVSSVDSLLN